MPEFAASAFLGGILGFVFLQVQDYLRRRRRRRALAWTFMADIERIREQLGKPADKYTELRLGNTVKALPSIHSWIQGLVVESSDIAPELVGEYMLLEHQLNTFYAEVQGLREAAGEVQYRQSGLKEAQERTDDPSKTALVKKNLRDVEIRAELHHDGVVGARKDAWKTTARIEQALKRHMDRGRKAVKRY